MNKSITKSVAAPVDGSEYAKQALAYLSHMFEKDESFRIMLCYILPTLPPILVEESRKSAKTAKKLAEIEDRNVQMAKKILSESKERLVEKGFNENQIETLYRKKKIGTARDICILSENKRVDALAIVSDRHAGTLRALVPFDPDLSAGRRVPDCVEDQVGERAVDLVHVAKHPQLPV